MEEQDKAIKERISAQKEMEKRAENTTTQEEPPPPNNKLTNAQGWNAEFVLVLAFSILTFVVISLITSAWILIKQKAKPYDTLRLFGLITILGLATFLVIVGYSIEQINGVVALFSAVAGYLLGRSDSLQNKEEEKPSSQPLSKENSDLK